MMEYADFYEIARYGNEHWNKGCFSHKEVAEYAYEYYADFQWSKENDELSFVIKELAKLLIDDVREMPNDEDSEQLRYWLHDMADELGLIDMDYCDYLETDEWLKVFETQKKEETTTQESEIYGIVFKDENGYSLWTDFELSKNEKNIISMILEKHVNEGGSVVSETLDGLLAE